MNYKGIIIEESLENKDVLKKISILDTKVEKVTENHQTPWIKQWTLLSVEMSEDIIESITNEISESLDSEHNFYVDFKNNKFHFIIFKNRIFKVDRSKPNQYNHPINYGLSLGIPNYQFDFSPYIKEWKR